jgi:hypothetical protein
MLTAAFPVFVTVTVCDVFCPIATLPKFKLAGDNAKLSVALGWDFPVTDPTQPLRKTTGKSTKTQRSAPLQPVENTRDLQLVRPTAHI